MLATEPPPAPLHKAQNYYEMDVSHSHLELTLKAMHAHDKYAMLDLYHTLSERTLYMRFFQVIAEPSIDELHEFTDIDYQKTFAISVFHGASNQLVAAGRLVKLGDTSDTAELSCIVSDDFQKQGIGAVLVKHLLLMGKQVGIKTVVAMIQGTNRAMVKLLKRSGYPCQIEFSGGEFEVVVNLDNEFTSEN
ncbi:GNAT family N-acetyltransferase [Paraferrimonas sp. SM1919]|uniref:GNAT family N-acetyltransferase n=1 Tax=Paraferrimonas sp. SM1919 TaxID=2662263 RepID=UPI0013D50E4D|nr:GNAT family N-acetyltransferase [Paraferrimonas sp. SM1919]